MKRTKITAALLSLVLTAGAMLPGCTAKQDSTQQGGQKKEVSVELLNSKGEIAPELEKIAQQYNSSNKDGIKVNITTVGTGGSVTTTLMSRYSAGNPPAMTMLDCGTEKSFKEKIADLSGEKWANDINPKFKVAATLDEKTVSFPFCVEGWGTLYNKTAIEKATGKTFDPAAVKNRSDLEKLYEAVQAGGITPTEISKDTWSLGYHLFSATYYGQSEDSAKLTSYMDDIKAGKVDFAQDKVFNALFDTFDLNMKYNIYKKAPLSADYNSTDPRNFAQGKVATWFNGTWVWSSVKQFTEDSKNEYGILPVFIGESDEDFQNKGIIAGVTKSIVIDKTKNSEDQQNAAKKFLNWLVYDTTGQKDYITSLNVISPFTSITAKPTDPLSLAVTSYIASGNILVANMQTNFVMPNDSVAGIGGPIQKYLVGQLSRKDLAGAINDYWKNVQAS